MFNKMITGNFFSILGENTQLFSLIKECTKSKNGSLVIFKKV